MKVHKHMFKLCVRCQNNVHVLIEQTVKKLIDEHKVVFDVVLSDFAEVRLHDGHHFRQKLKHQRRIDVLFGRHRQPYVRPFYMEKAGSGDVSDWRSDLLPRMDYVHTECIHCIPPVRNYNRKPHISAKLTPELHQIKILTQTWNQILQIFLTYGWH